MWNTMNELKTIHLCITRNIHLWQKKGIFKLKDAEMFQTLTNDILLEMVFLKIFKLNWSEFANILLRVQTGTSA